MPGTLAVKLLQKLAPLPEGYATAGPSLEDLRPRFRKWRIWGVLIFFVGIVPSGFAWWYVFREIGVRNAARFQPAVFHLHAADEVLAVPCLFLGFATSGALLMVAYRHLLGENYADYVRYDNLSTGYDSRPVARPMLLGVFGLSILFLGAAISWHVVFQQDQVMFRSWYGLAETTKLYSEVKDIRTAAQLRAPNGNLVDRREYIVEFDDGSTWSTNFEPSALDPQAKRQLAAFVADQAKKPVRELAVLE